MLPYFNLGRENYSYPRILLLERSQGENHTPTDNILRTVRLFYVICTRVQIS